MYRQLAQQQDHHLDQLNQIVINTNQGQRGLQNQLVLDRQILNNFHNEIDYTTQRMNIVQKKLANLLQTSDTGQICSLIIMLGFTLCMVLMIIIL